MKRAPVAPEFANANDFQNCRDKLRLGNPAQGTRAEFLTTVRKWSLRGGGMPTEKLGRTEIRVFLKRFYERAVADHGINLGRTANKAR